MLGRTLGDNLMKEDLKDRIKNFLVGWDHTSMDDSFGIEDYDLWMEEAVDLLTEIVENNK